MFLYGTDVLSLLLSVSTYGRYVLLTFVSLANLSLLILIVNNITNC